MPKAKSVFLDFVRHVVNGEIDEVSRRLAASPSLATAPADVGAARHGAPDFFFTEIAHYLYAGDTALHMAAAAFRRPIAEAPRRARGGLPREESPRSRTPSLRGGRQPLGTDGTGGDDRVPLVGRRRSQRLGQERRGAPAPSGANTVVARSPGAAGWRRQPEGAKQGRLDAPAPCRSNHWARRERF